MTSSSKRKSKNKGEYGYLRQKSILVAFWTVLLFGVALSLYAAGIITTGSNRNLLTIVAILGCLPACKSTVNLIMYLRATGCSESVSAKIESQNIKLPQLYDLYFTSYQKNYPVSHLAVAGKLIVGYTELTSMNTAECEKHLETTLKQGGLKQIHIKIYQDLEQYCDGIKKLSNERQAETGGADEEELASMISGILAISL